MGNTQSNQVQKVEDNEEVGEQVRYRNKGSKRPHNDSRGSNDSNSSNRTSKRISGLFGTSSKTGEIRRDTFVAALDIGTTFSGYAISLLTDYNKDPLNIQTFNWISRFDGHVTYKMPSDLLLRPDGTFHSFGYDAEYNYANLPTRQHKLWYYFKSFKMMLYESPKLNRFTVIKDVTGKEIFALDVFCYCIYFLKNDIMTKLQQQIDIVQESDIHFVLTVPAIWSDKAKQFMREAAERARIEGSKLSLALEPEAAAIFCQHVPTTRQTYIGFPPSLTSAKDTTLKYLVVDLGGGTVDITGFHSTPDGVLRELMSARGGDWGSNAINDSFVKYLGNIFTFKVIDEFRSNHPEEYMNLLASFERKKIVFDPEKDDRVTLSFPVTLRTAIKKEFEKKPELYLQDSPFSDSVQIIHDKMVISKDAFAEYFAETIAALIRSLTCLLSRNKYGIETILLVGGFANCPVLQKAIHNNFSNFRIIIPHEANVAVLKGAILFGRNPHTVKARVIRKTYGVRSCNNYDPDKHPPEKRIVLNGQLVVGNIFDTHIISNQIAEVGQKFAREIYYPVIDSQSTVTVEIYTADGKAPLFVTDRESSYLGKLVVELHSSRKSFLNTNSRKVQVRFKFDGTEIEVEAMVIKTKEIVSAKFDFLG
ncbi:heat shock 70 kDa protein 12A-like [Mytilus californianus]|uniref:heat shock 70 kDa protein 12A-like n=1 Tax=Mytilus californianus TaxID=6549 RepID=UPI0022462F5D|nr:heat shock 70 kDa protein 12A-like [Mytilus californianus]